MTTPREISPLEAGILELLQDASLEIIASMAVHIICQSRGAITLDQLVDRWEAVGLHHMLLEQCYPETKEQEGEEYASALDAFESEIIDRIGGFLGQGDSDDTDTVPS